MERWRFMDGLSTNTNLGEDELRGRRSRCEEEGGRRSRCEDGGESQDSGDEERVGELMIGGLARGCRAREVSLILPIISYIYHISAGEKRKRRFF